MHILTLNMRRPHTFCVYIGLRKQKLLLTCEIFAFYHFLGCFVFLENSGKQLQSWGFGKDRSGYSKHKYFFSPNSDKKKHKTGLLYFHEESIYDISKPLHAWYASKSVTNGRMGTVKQKQICPLNFFEVGGINMFIA